jgi:hypothetical protein
MAKAIKCESCGKFRKEEHLVTMWGECDEIWTECYFCCSEADRERYFKDAEEEVL